MTGSQSTFSELLTGQFRDGPFVGLDYQTPSQKGCTNVEGKFLYQAGEVVTFSIGRLTIWAASAAPHLTLAALHDTDRGLDRITLVRTWLIASISYRALRGT